MILVTGTGRSGTHYTAVVMQKLGLDIPHEAVGKDGASSWKHIVSGTSLRRQWPEYLVYFLLTRREMLLLQRRRRPLFFQDLINLL